ncbi:RdgB/HAM1 family non-canonical purine NTP pyrophosphatase [Wenzhouxiangella sediminis]|uniref:dITP/XTP pyrophosphatase n=1 Tax=Wenzhouxiangella sediminis TaxID=1792836 RepID=A0A3E1KA81_9GAMM|nr:RdgB/HAM1 family non-canonical purine NTP pyrophosphatase [Wenzhouxiangella sediminis]RFF30632.1 RdgB/HAM1 family non-canonical purine NTP pyrophosphatase [Wenzhouxiangella sediminis]
MALDGGKLVLASGNKGKLRELAHMLEPLHIEVVSQAEFDVTPVEETGLTFVENALLKAREASRVSGLPALGDDSGLVVDALDGRPGIYSSRFAGESASDADNNDKLLAELVDLPMERRTAHFHCCLVLLRQEADPVPIIAEGIWHGHILEAPRGEGGFGYDPLFHDRKLGATAAELPMEEKARVSHRGLALAALVEQLNG